MAFLYDESEDNEAAYGQLLSRSPLDELVDLDDGTLVGCGYVDAGERNISEQLHLARALLERFGFAASGCARSERS